MSYLGLNAEAEDWGAEIVNRIHTKILSFERRLASLSFCKNESVRPANRVLFWDKEGNYGQRKQKEIHAKTETQSQPHRKWLRKAWREQKGSETPRLGDGQ